MDNFRRDFKYKVQPQKDGSFVVLSKYLPSGKVDIVSHHDTMKEAEQEMEDLQKPVTQPSQAEVLKQLRGMNHAIDDFNDKNL